MASLIDRVNECERLVRGFDARLRRLEEVVGVSTEAGEADSGFGRNLPVVVMHDALHGDDAPKFQPPKMNKRHLNAHEGEALRQAIAAFIKRRAPDQTTLTQIQRATRIKSKGALSYHLKVLRSEGAAVLKSRGVYAAPSK